VKRTIMNHLVDWAKRANRKPLVLRGARQVGKTTVVRMLAEELDLRLVEINLEDSHSFESMLKERSKARELLELILLEHGISDAPENVLFFFDEAQESVDLYPYLRYFYELSPEYKIIAAGSLFELEIHRSERAQGPTGRVEYAYLEPMTFSEYLEASNPIAYNIYHQINFDEPLSESLHTVYSKLFREYLVSGGLPEVVQATVNKESPRRIDQIKSDILRGYIEDLPKYSKLAGVRFDPKLLEQVMKSVYGKPSHSLSYSKIAEGFRAEVVRRHMDVLSDAKIIRMSLHSSENTPPLSTATNPKSYKLFGLDIGLCYTFMGVPLSQVYSSVDINSDCNGDIAEQYIAQSIQANSLPYKTASLHHWENPSRTGKAEVDFLIEKNGKVIPVECKSGKSGKMKSLRVLLESKKYTQAVRIYSENIAFEDIHVEPRNKAGDVDKDRVYSCRLLSIPHYLIDRYLTLETM